MNNSMTALTNPNRLLALAGAAAFAAGVLFTWTYSRDRAGHPGEILPGVVASIVLASLGLWWTWRPRMPSAFVGLFVLGTGAGVLGGLLTASI